MSSSVYFQETKLGALTLKNKFVVAPLTRMRGDQPGMVPNDLMKEYYAQRAGFGLILTECSQVSDKSNCFLGSGGIHTKEQAEGWKKVVDAVHEKGGLIMLQIWHCGRAVSSCQINGQTPIGPSAIAIKSTNFLTKDNEPYPVPHELTIEEIKEVVEQYRQGAEYAKLAGFDGVELHGANGYLVDQFLRDGSNKRTDIYGGSIENRSRFCFEVIDALASVFGYDRVAVRFSPTGRYNGQYDSNPLELMKYVLGELSKKNLAFVELKRHGALETFIPVPNDDRIAPSAQISDFFNQLRPFYQGNLIVNDGVSIEEGTQLINSGVAQAVSFGVLSISNPDLPERIKNGWEVNTTIDKNTWFFGGEKGYTDYPVYKKQE